MAQERLPQELRHKLCSFVRAGTTRITAAVACGLTVEQLREACDSDQEFVAEIEKAEIEARTATEIQLRQKSPREWLKQNPGAAHSRPKASQSDAAAWKSATARQMPEKHRRFAHEYVIDDNATQAAIRAGYAPRSAYNAGHRLMKNDDVRAEILAKRAAIYNALDVDAKRTLREIAAIAFADPADLFDESGQLREIRHMPPAVRHALGVEITIVKGPGGAQVAEVQKIRSRSKDRALSILSEHLGILNAPEKPDDNRMSLDDLREVLRMWDEHAAERRAKPVDDDDVPLLNAPERDHE